VRLGPSSSSFGHEVTLENSCFEAADVYTVQPRFRETLHSAMAIFSGIPTARTPTSVSFWKSARTNRLLPVSFTVMVYLHSGASAGVLGRSEDHVVSISEAPAFSANIPFLPNPPSYGRYHTRTTGVHFVD
jgi:hypothetical protein